jgi:uncharacterized protein DUF3386
VTKVITAVVVSLGSVLIVVSGGLADPAPAKPAAKPDPAATKLLAEARAARATWQSFPGFTADVEVNLDGKVSRGQVEVNDAGRVTYVGLDTPGKTWARPVLSSLVGHRLDGGGDGETPCTFPDQDETHPLGRAIRILGDGLHSGYRIRDRQIMLVDRRDKERRFTITIQENRVNEEGKFLPISYVVDYWSLTTGALLESEAHVQSWKRIGRFDLPAGVRITAAHAAAKGQKAGELGPEAYSAKTLTLTNHKLLKAETK